jgi:CRISPR-associated protein Csb1
VFRDGRRSPLDLSPEAALSYATAAATAFGVGSDRRVTFRKELAQADLKEKGKKAAAPAAAAS